MTILLNIKNISCKYHTHTVVKELSFHANQGEMICLVGPSGCGKTTVLRAIAGFEPILSGEITLHDNIISRTGYQLAPEKRKIGMVFQDYALFPHMNICNNICFGLRKQSKQEKLKITNQMLSIVGLEGLGSRYPHELSGGQQQRVALARALAPMPDIILMDEPFSNLDVEMRESLSQEIRSILKSQGVTGILVTHDQHEAFAMADVIGVMKDGEIQQWDTAYNLYHEPANPFVADFIGQGIMLDGTLISPNQIETEIGIVKGDRAYDWQRGSKVKLLLRPDDVISDQHGELIGEITQRAFKGAEIMYTIRLSTGTEVLSLFPSHHDHFIGDKVRLSLAADHMIAFPVELN
ncbi:Ferric iron ABC transporter, ATP-binding protein [hydrothermal vent metagenome]|uniref:Ferric iron ABC transporter, ATP-binding protein n=1 Tax=hydrothermal vent metagenome TaxID=652676 RepID=A0A3B0ZUZ6_9ZZZZ